MPLPPPLQLANAAAEFCMSQKYASHHEAPNLFLQIHSSLVEIKLYEDASDKNAYRHAMKVIHLYVQGNLTLEVLLKIQNICKHFYFLQINLFLLFVTDYHLFLDIISLK